MKFNAFRFLVGGSLTLILSVLNAACQQSLELDTNCIVSVLNRSARVKADGTWRIDNVPANMGLVRVRATCLKNGITLSGQSEFILLEPNINNGFSPFPLGNATQIPSTLTITTPSTTLSAVGASAQLTVTATYPDKTTKNVSAAADGTSYTISSPATATISPDGLVTAKASGTVVISAINDGAIGMIQLHVVLSGDSDGDGIPDDLEIANGLNPNNPVDAQEDPDGDGLTNFEELMIYGTNPRLKDTDGDGISDGDEVHGTLGYVTNPLLADSDGDGVRDLLEIQTGSDPTDRSSLNLAQALQSLEVKPRSFTLTVNSITGEASRQLAVIGHLKDGSTIDLTSTARGTIYNSSDLFVANFGAPDGRVFAGNDGLANITVSNSGFTDTASVIVRSFAPTALSFVNIPGFANNVDVNGNYAYVAAGSAGLQVVDVSNRTAPVVVASRDTPGNANDVKVMGNLAFIADGPSGLQIIDISNPLAPVTVGSLDTPGEAYDVAVSGNRAYIADGPAGLQIIDVSNPAAPVFLGTVDTPGTAKGVDVSGNVAVVADGGAGVQVIDISNPAHPTILGSRSTGGDARDITLNGNFAYVADFSRSFTVVDITNPANPILGPSTPESLGGLLQDVVLRGRFAFGADVFFVNGVPIIDVNDPGNPIPRAILDFRGFRDDNGTGIAVDNQYVYLTAESGTITENGVSGITRLYIGQYQAIEDTAGIPPVVKIMAPVNGATLIEGRTIIIQVSASDDIAVAAVAFLVNGQPVFTDTSAPFEYAFTVPVGVTSVSFGAQAIDFGDNIGVAPDVIAHVIPNSPPTVSITSPTATVIEGETITLSADASDDAAVDSVVFTVNGLDLPPETTAPYNISFKVPTGITLLTIVATATDDLGKQALDARTVSVIPDPGTTVVGRLLDATSNPAVGVTVTTLGNHSAITANDGSFRMLNVPTVLGNIRVTATVAVGNAVLVGSSQTFAPSRGGDTDVGTIVLKEQRGLTVQFFDTPDPVGAVASGFAGLIPVDFTVTTETETVTVSSYVVPVVNFPDTDFDVDAFYNVGPNGGIDPGSTATAPRGDDISIQPLGVSPTISTDAVGPQLRSAVVVSPGGNDLFGAQFSGYLVLPSGGDVTFTVGVDDVFDLIVNGDSVVGNLNPTDFTSFSGTAINLPAGPVPIILNYGELFIEADLVLSASGGGLPGGVIGQEFLTPDPGTTVVGQVVDANGNAVAGAVVTVFNTPIVTTGGDGKFLIEKVSTVLGPLVVKAAAVNAGQTLRGNSAPTTGVRGGVTDVGQIVLRNAARRVLILSGGHSDDTATVRNGFAAQMPDLTFETFFVSAALPSQSFLSRFDVVLLFENGLIGDSHGLGNTIFDYIQAGGNVVFGVFYGQDRTGGGFGKDWGNLETIDPFTSSGTPYSSGSLDPASLVTHPLTEGIMSLQVGSYRGGVAAKAETTVVAKWSDGVPLLGYVVLPGGQRLLGLSIFPPDFAFTSVSGDYYQLWKNALTWTGEPGAPQPVP